MFELDTLSDKFRIFGFFLTIALLAGFSFAILSSGIAGIVSFFTTVSLIFLVISGIGALVSGIGFLIYWLG